MIRWTLLLVLLGMPAHVVAQRPPVSPRDLRAAASHDARPVTAGPSAESRASSSAGRLPLPLEGPQGRTAGSLAAGSDSAKRVVMSLALVLGAFFMVAWLGRRRSVDNSLLPEEAVALLGELPLGGRDRVRLIKVGSKLVLISASAQGLQPLTEVDDPNEVARLIDVCRIASGAQIRGRSAA